MATEPMPDPDGKDDDTGGKGGEKPDAGDENEDEQLGEAGKKALEAERQSRKALERQLKGQSAELDKLRRQSMSDQEKAVDEAKAEARKAALGEVSERLLAAEITTLAAGKLADPSDAVGLVDRDGLTDADGAPDKEAISKAIDELVKRKPYLANGERRPKSLPGGGATSSEGMSMDDYIRLKAKG